MKLTVYIGRVAAAALALAAACGFDPSTRWDPDMVPSDVICALGTMRCSGGQLEICASAAAAANWELFRDCGAEQRVCASALHRCTACQPDATYCDGQTVTRCSSDGEQKTPLETCDNQAGKACRLGVCSLLCDEAFEQKSNVGCEYLAADLDNAMISYTKNASAQQYAVVVSNPQPDVPVALRIERDDGLPGQPSRPILVAEAVIAPLNLRVFKLGPREVDGSPPGQFDTGSHTALTRAAYRITSDFPVVAYQFNPLENVGVFSNDASLLKPREALTFDTQGLSLAYVVAGWPQTIAHTDDPNTNFSARSPINLRAFLTVVATRPDTRVRVTSTTAVVGGGPVADTPPGGTIEMVLDAFDVLNLETGDFNADFTGSLVEADAPVAVFVGSEASDAPQFSKLSERRCCADHLEEQLDPVRTAGKRFVLTHSPSRTGAVAAAGATLDVAPEPEYVRFVAARDRPTRVTTSLAAPDHDFVLSGLGDWREVETTRDFVAESDEPIHVAQIQASQDAANIPRGLPGGDPSLLVVPPVEQYRADYVFLTPDKYAFDFVTIAAPVDATVYLDARRVDDSWCEVAPADGWTDEQRGDRPLEFSAYRCQLSFAAVDPYTGEVLPGEQNDGVHRIIADAPVGVTVFGFDAYVSYAYAAGTELREIAPPR
ncbi:MAG: IgGFc-binding protein [Deltaproteobacteria bacterium]|jgi:hypothetical protein|nr:IgGFc-binding protein [Deltaproteobacteria bacterium]MBW2533421.1 IgGFc-binding protein [Deltaproteobacteria bacterium]